MFNVAEWRTIRQQVRVEIHWSTLLRPAAVSLILCVCLFAGTTSLPFVLARLGLSLPVRIYSMGTIAAVALEPDGRLVIHMTSRLLRYENADMLAFIYLHELGHVRLGHLLPQGSQQTQYFAPSMWRTRVWRMEYDADEWAARQLRRIGYDPVQGIGLTFGVFGDGGGFTHPPDKVRIDRVRRLPPFDR